MGKFLMNSLLDFYEAKEDGLFYVGHASIIAKLGGKNYLFDYIKNSQPYGGEWRFFPPLIHDINLDYIDGIFVSHLH
jgi:L-ascorbate metabolism protein UlaG (beta-lactamase superfamily)